MTSCDSSTPVTAAYQHCLKIARSHYENFPVASWILPRHMRLPVAAVYAFARMADDIADEGDADNEQRIQQLENMGRQLDAISAGQTPDDPMYIAVADTISRYQLPVALFHDLLSAFKQDVTRKRYDNFNELLDYCRRSANPVGRLLLYIYGQTDEQSLQQSDAVCSALQLINFYQDLSQDYHEMDRIYIPQDEMTAASVSEDHIKNAISDSAMHHLMRQQYDRARDMMLSGAPLGKTLKGRFGFEIRLIIAAGLAVLDKLSRQQQDLFSRPRLGKGDAAGIAWKALRKS